MTAFGIPNANMGDNFTSGLGEFDMDGTGSNFGDGLGVGRCNCPLIEKERQYQFVGNVTKMEENHQLSSLVQMSATRRTCACLAIRTVQVFMRSVISPLPITESED